MFDTLQSPTLDDDHEWAERSEFWRQGAQQGRPRGRRERETAPLVLCGHGVSLRVDAGALVVRNGFTHYPQPEEAYRFFKGDLACPSRIIMLDGSGSLSFDVLTWLSEQGVSLSRITWDGEAVSVVGAAGYAADRERVRWQEDTRTDEGQRLAFSADLIRRKFVNSITTLENHVASSPARETAIARAYAGAAQLAERVPVTLEALRLIEAQCASAYFAAWAGMPIRWKGTARRPVPVTWHAYISRGSLANGRKILNINASHPLNAMLNYAYAALQTRLHVEAVASGYDPTIGVMHHGRRGKPAFVFDLMEPERPNVDAAVLAFVAQSTFSAADFLLRGNGVCRLSPHLATRVCRVVEGIGRTASDIPAGFGELFRYHFSRQTHR